MRQFDVFNGDADGICALLQLRLAEPGDSILITGVKRDIALLDRVDAAVGDRVTVLDVSLDKNAQALKNVLAAGARVFYADHHFPGEMPSHPNLQILIETAADVCTSVLIDRYLQHRYSAWAAVGAFGDNLDTVAYALAGGLGLDDHQIESLRRLGICINYNAYGAAIDDLHFDPCDLYRLLSEHTSPLDFIAAKPQVYQQLLDGYREDMELAWAIEPAYLGGATAVYLLPNQKWARRVGGVWGNELANRHPARAHAILTDLGDNAYAVSVRAPLNRKMGADTLCLQFAGGGGRKAAAGINRLATEHLSTFIDAFDRQYPG